MTIVASCGHELAEDEDTGYIVQYVGEDRRGRTCITEATYCRDCARKLLDDVEMCLSIKAPLYYEHPAAWEQPIAERSDEHG